MKNLLKFLLVLGIVAVVCGLPTFILPSAGIPVIFPHIQLPAEPVITFTGDGTGFNSLFLSNTFLSVLLADIILIIMAVVAGSAARRRMNQFAQNAKSVDEEGYDMMVPKGWQNTLEAILEYMHNLVEGIVGSKWASSVFPVATTIFLLVLVANYLHFVPLVDTVGTLHCSEHGYEAVELGDSGIYRLGFAEEAGFFPGAEHGDPCPSHGEDAHGEEEAHAEEAADDAHAEETDGHADEKAHLKYNIIPWMRTAATDLNLTFALALVAMFTVQYLGVRELGFGGYFSKFFNLPALSHGFLGWIELIVSWLEIISEVFKVVSLAFRLFGNIFAGAILLLVMAFLIPVGAPLVFWLLEVLIGAIQAFVFAMLTIVFVAVAQAGHGDHDDEHH